MEVRRKPIYEDNGSLGTALQWVMFKWLQRVGVLSRKGYGFVECCRSKRPDTMNQESLHTEASCLGWGG